MSKGSSLLALDVGEKRIGVAIANTKIRIAIAYDCIEVDGSEIDRLQSLVNEEAIDTIVIGYPRNQSGEPTAQTQFVEDFAKKIEPLGREVIFQDESLTSVKAEEQLKAQGKPYSKGEIDSLAASFILEDYMEEKYGRF